MLGYLFLALYACVVPYISFRASRNQSARDFLNAERSEGMFSAVATINATKTGSIVLLYTAMLYSFGGLAYLLFVGIAIGYVCFIPMALRIHRDAQEAENGYITMADYFSARSPVAGRSVSLLNVCAMTGLLSLNLMAAATALQQYEFLSVFELDFLTTKSLAIAIVAVFVGVYLFPSGFRAVVKTDVFQYAVLLLILSMVPFLFNAAEVKGTFKPVSDTPGAATGFYLLLTGTLVPFASPDLWQRIYAIRDVRTVKRSILVSVPVHLLVGAILTVIGHMAIRARPRISDEDVLRQQADRVLIEAFQDGLPGWSGFVLLLFFAAFMSSIDTYAFTAASSLASDFSRGSDQSKVRLVRKFLILILALGAVAAIALKDLQTCGLVFSGFIIVLAIPVVAVYFRPDLSNRALNYGIIGGALGYSCLLFRMLPAPHKEQPRFVLLGAVLSGLSLGVGAVVNRLKPPSPPVAADSPGAPV